MGFAADLSGAASGRNQIRNSKFEIRISNIEQGNLNDETFLSFDVHYSLFDIRHSLLNDKKLNALKFT